MRERVVQIAASGRLARLVIRPRSSAMHNQFQNIVRGDHTKQLALIVYHRQGHKVIFVENLHNFSFIGLSVH